MWLCDYVVIQRKTQSQKSSLAFGLPSSQAPQFKACHRSKGDKFQKKKNQENQWHQ